MFYKWILALALFLSGFQGAFAQKKFLSSYISFDIQRDWKCQNFGVNWICWHFTDANQAPALIVSTAGKIDIPPNSITELLSGWKQDFKIDIDQLIKSEKFKAEGRQRWAGFFLHNRLSSKLFSRSASTVCCDKLDEKFIIFVGFYAPQNDYTSYIYEFIHSLNSLSFETNLKTLIAKYRHSQQMRYNEEMSSFLDGLYTYPSSNEQPKSKRDLIIRGLTLTSIILLIYLIYSIGGFDWLKEYIKRFFYKKPKRKRR